ncbi:MULTISPECIES: hypothetical protein [unclassified Pseudomonas]|uniref:hypothetical protein n=1 Tax=unclassified Pseudomonas TaxID=196821 RepID=UPI003BA385DE
MSKKRQAGFEQAKHQHQAGFPIEMLVLAARDMPSSQYTLGFLTYVTDQQIAQVQAKKATESRA